MSPVRDKNASPGFEFVINKKISQTRPTEKASSDVSDDVNVLLEYVW